MCLHGSGGKRREAGFFATHSLPPKKASQTADESGRRQQKRAQPRGTAGPWGGQQASSAGRQGDCRQSKRPGDRRAGGSGQANSGGSDLASFQADTNLIDSAATAQARFSLPAKSSANPRSLIETLQVAKKRRMKWPQAPDRWKGVSSVKLVRRGERSTSEGDTRCQLFAARVQPNPIPVRQLQIRLGNACTTCAAQSVAPEFANYARRPGSFDRNKCLALSLGAPPFPVHAFHPRARESDSSGKIPAITTVFRDLFRHWQFSADSC